MDSAISLYELNNTIKSILSGSMPDAIWVRAEMSDVRTNQNGHCYLEFIEKDASGRNVVARMRGVIWSSTFRMLKMYFESETNQSFSSGIKVLVKVSVDFHEAYGLNLTVHDIDPTYTLGDQAKNRALILKQLEEDGVLTLNKELEFPIPANRIAVISSPTAAGYEDFCNQLENNSDGFVFYTKLFPAVMQGEKTEESIVAALERIFENANSFDVVVIIRGGGATSELSSFDSYLLAASCAQFPLPVITGIGHERDDTVLDVVAYARAKTPTAVAEYLIGKMVDIRDEYLWIEQEIVALVNNTLTANQVKLETLSSRFSYLLKDRTREQMKDLDSMKFRLTTLVDHYLSDAKKDLLTKEKYLELISPQNILKKGYSITLKNGKAVKSVASLKKGDLLTTLLADGEITSQVN